MKLFFALLDIALVVFFMSLIGTKNTHDFAFGPDLYPWFFWGTLGLIVVITYALLPKKSR